MYVHSGGCSGDIVEIGRGAAGRFWGAARSWFCRFGAGGAPSIIGRSATAYVGMWDLGAGLILDKRGPDRDTVQRSDGGILGEFGVGSE